MVAEPEFEEALIAFDLLGSGYVDSIGVMRLVQFTEARFGVRVPPADITIENFLTVRRIASYLQGRVAANGHAP